MDDTWYAKGYRDGLEIGTIGRMVIGRLASIAYSHGFKVGLREREKRKRES